MNILPCRVCDEKFSSKSMRRKFCSAECAESAVVNHGASGYSRGCRCSTCRAGQLAAITEYNARKRLEDGISPDARYKRKRRGSDEQAEVPCFICKLPLANVRADIARYPLHKACRVKAPNWIKCGYDKPTPKRDAFLRKADKASAGSFGNRVFICGGCRWCGTLVVGVGFYCSDNCKKSAAFKRRSSGASFQISPRARKEIYERDSWTCQLCFHPVNSELHYRDNWAASLDHIIPQSQQLIPDHSPSNLRLAHRMCNSMRGDGSNMTESEISRRIAMHFQEAA